MKEEKEMKTCAWQNFEGFEYLRFSCMVSASAFSEIRIFYHLSHDIRLCQKIHAN